MNKSIQTIDSPEFINLQPTDLNPMISKCEIKVLYVGKNRNGSFISKEVATEMSKTLRGAMIVGYFKEEKDDFRDHGKEIVSDADGLHFNCMTSPYGFVAPDAKVWFQFFEDSDDFGNTVTREYLMTEGYLWTGHFKELESVMKNGKPQSMELEETIEGKWSIDPNTGLEFFIINDATFSKLCILGDDIEPCFEGASITAPFVSKDFSISNNEFRTTLYSMMKDLENIVLKGGKLMFEENGLVQASENIPDSVESESENNITTESAESNESVETYTDVEPTYENSTESEATIEVNAIDYQKEYEELNAKYKLLEEECAELRKFKKCAEDEKKDKMISKFSMLTDKEKEDVINNKDKYSLEEIESKLSVLCVRKQMVFNLQKEEEEKKKQQPVITTFNIVEDDSLAPAWIIAARNNK